MSADNNSQTRSGVKVLCVTPVGQQGMGGIDRLYYYMREHMRASGSRIDLRFFAARGEGGGLKWVLMFPLRVIAFAYMLVRFAPDVVHINHSTHGSAFRKWVLASIAHLFGKTVTTHFHGLVAAEDYAKGPTWLGWFRALCAKSDKIVILGDFFAEDLRKRFNVDPDKLIVIPNGIPDFAADLAVPKPMGDVPTLLFAGEVGPRKGAGLLLEALANLKQKAPAFRCIIAGNGDIPEYRSMAGMLGLGDRVIFTGWVGPDEVHGYMREADIVILPSRIEALPLSLIEGACAGAALVASNAGASGEVAVDGRNGIIVPLSSESIADALAHLLTHPAVLEKMKAESRKLFVERFRIDQFETSLTALFITMADDKPAEPAGQAMKVM